MEGGEALRNVIVFPAADAAVNPAPDAGGHLARTLPGRFYHDPAIWEREQERLFGRLWVCVGRADQFPATGRYRTVQRRRRERPRGPRRGRRPPGLPQRLPPPRRPALSGRPRVRPAPSSAAITPGPTGSTVASCAPRGSQDSAGFDRAAFGLVRRGRRDVGRARVGQPCSRALRRSRRSSFPRSPARLGDAGAPRAPTGSAPSRSASTIEYEVRANWKVVVENFMECYHCAPMHPELVRLLPAFRSGATQEYRARHARSPTMSRR